MCSINRRGADLADAEALVAVAVAPLREVLAAQGAEEGLDALVRADVVICVAHLHELLAARVALVVLIAPPRLLIDVDMLLKAFQGVVDLALPNERAVLPAVPRQLRRPLRLFEGQFLMKTLICTVPLLLIECIARRATCASILI